MKNMIKTAPVVEPISLADAKLFLRVDHNDDDSLIDSLITSSRQLLESYLNIALIEQTWVWSFDSWSQVAKYNSSCSQVIASLTSINPRYIKTPKSPLISVISIKTYDVQDSATNMDLSDIVVGVGENRIALVEGATWPQPSRTINGIEITYKVGLGSLADDVPAILKQAMLKLIATHYTQRDEQGLVNISSMPKAIATMLAPYKSLRL